YYAFGAEPELLVVPRDSCDEANESIIITSNVCTITNHSREQMVLNLIVQMTSEPVVISRWINILCGAKLHMHPITYPLLQCVDNQITRKSNQPSSSKRISIGT